MAHLTRRTAQEKLRLEECFAVAQGAKPDDRARWVSEMRKQAGY